MHPGLTQQLSAAHDYDLHRFVDHRPSGRVTRTSRRFFSIKLIRRDA